MIDEKMADEILRKLQDDSYSLLKHGLLVGLVNEIQRLTEDDKEPSMASVWFAILVLEYICRQHVRANGMKPEMQMAMLKASKEIGTAVFKKATECGADSASNLFSVMQKINTPDVGEA